MGPWAPNPSLSRANVIYFCARSSYSPTLAREQQWHSSPVIWRFIVSDLSLNEWELQLIYCPPECNVKKAVCFTICIHLGLILTKCVIFILEFSSHILKGMSATTVMHTTQLTNERETLEKRKAWLEIRKYANISVCTQQMVACSITLYAKHFCCCCPQFQLLKAQQC